MAARDLALSPFGPRHTTYLRPNGRRALLDAPAGRRTWLGLGLGSGSGLVRARARARARARPRARARVRARARARSPAGRRTRPTLRLRGGRCRCRLLGRAVAAAGYHPSGRLALLARCLAASPVRPLVLPAKPGLGVGLGLGLGLGSGLG
eukprot:scaffold48209_cov38-Phaeocystis_antarctica.AAC.1